MTLLCSRWASRGLGGFKCQLQSIHILVTTVVSDRLRLNNIWAGVFTTTREHLIGCRSPYYASHSSKFKQFTTTNCVQCCHAATRCLLPNVASHLRCLCLCCPLQSAKWVVTGGDKSLKHVASHLRCLCLCCPLQSAKWFVTGGDKSLKHHIEAALA